jgi:hypothetical protein
MKKKSVIIELAFCLVFEFPKWGGRVQRRKVNAGREKNRGVMLPTTR